jgi:pyruvate-formate lyase-activating enzyme
MFSQKILCLGNNSADTNQRVFNLAKENQSVNHGLINDKSFVPLISGYYHTTVVDLQFGEIVNIAEYFDTIMLLDQPQDKWSHPTMFSSTNKLINDLRELGYKISYENREITKNYDFFTQLLETNKSFCIYPFIHLLSWGDGYTHLCDTSRVNVAKLKDLDWQNDSAIQKIRNNMLEGKLNEPHCNYCYGIERAGGKPARHFDTLDWVTRLNLSSLEDLKKITSPKYYSVRPSNKCNIRCRSCIPNDSHLIEKEFKKIGIGFDKIKQDRPGFDMIDVNNVERLLVAGGEPTVMPEFYEFLQKCIDAGHTDFDFCINTNAVKISDKLLNLLDHFTHFSPSVSLDGISKVNDYIRWGSDFDQIVKNTHKLVKRNHWLAFITVVSIYNITSLHKVMEFQDSEFPGASVMLQFDSFKDDIQSPYNHPNTELALASLEKCKKTNAYFDYSRGTKSIIDSLYDHYASRPAYDVEKLRKFFEFNDKLDQSRGHKLIDYIPELEQARKYI